MLFLIRKLMPNARWKLLWTHDSDEAISILEEEFPLNVTTIEFIENFVSRHRIWAFILDKAKNESESMSLATLIVHGPIARGGWFTQHQFTLVFDKNILVSIKTHVLIEFPY